MKRSGHFQSFRKCGSICLLKLFYCNPCDTVRHSITTRCTSHGNQRFAAHSGTVACTHCASSRTQQGSPFYNIGLRKDIHRLSLSLSHVICSLIIYDTMRCGYTEEMPSHLICYLSLSFSPVRYICRRICQYAVLTYSVNRSVTARNAIAFNTSGMGRAASTNINAREQGYRIHDFLLNELYLRCGSKRNSLGDGYYKRYHV